MMKTEKEKKRVNNSLLKLKDLSRTYCIYFVIIIYII